MGTVGGLRTRRYHGLFVAATTPPAGRMLALAAIDPVLVLGDARIRLAVHDWADGSVDPTGYLELASFVLEDGLPRWRWEIGATIVERELAPIQGRPGLAVVHRIVRSSAPVAPRGSSALGHLALDERRRAASQRRAPSVDQVADGYVFENAYRVAGPGFTPAGEWFRGVRYREEAARGLPDREDLWHAGAFSAELEPGQSLTVSAWKRVDNKIRSLPQHRTVPRPSMRLAPGPAASSSAHTRPTGSMRSSCLPPTS